MNQEVKTDLSSYDNSWYYPGNIVKRVLWYFCNIFFFINPLFPFNRLKVNLLRLFGAKMGKGIVLKPHINIKYPWNLEVGNHTWIGEEVWIDNLAKVRIGSNCCISQGALLLCGNHNYKKRTFDLLVRSIIVEDGAWIGSKTIVCPGVTCHTHSILTVGSVAVGDLEPYYLYQGNPAQKLRKRVMKG